MISRLFFLMLVCHGKCFGLSTDSKANSFSENTDDFEFEQENHYVIKHDKAFCFVAEFNVTIDISFPIGEGKTQTSQFIPASLTVSPESNCNPEDIHLNLTWRPQTATKDWIFSMHFKKVGVENGNAMEYYFSLNSVNVFYFAEAVVFPKISVKDYQTLTNNQSLYRTPIGFHYECNSEDSIDLKAANPSNKDEGVVVRLKQTKIEAFMDSKTDSFSEKTLRCRLDDKPDNTIPIAVGVTLAVCIIGALIAFVIFNRRSRQHYGSV